MSEHITPGRVVAIATPVFAALAGFISSKAAEVGLDLNAGELQAIFIAGATLALGPALLWLKGWQDWEKLQALSPAGVSSDLRLEEATAERSMVSAAGAPADVGAGVEPGDSEMEDDGFGEELLADGIDEDLDEFGEDVEDEDLDAVDDSLVVHGKEVAMALEVSTLTACGVPEEIARRHLPYMTSAMRKYGITTRPRARAFLATILHESGALRHSTEQASGAQYEGNKALGNTQRGDGQRFKGRGPIQLTGRCELWLLRAQAGA